MYYNIVFIDLLNNSKQNKMKTKYTRDEIQTISRNMIRYGGSFFKLIGEALQRADEENTKKLINAFPEECEKYLMGWK